MTMSGEAGDAETLFDRYGDMVYRIAYTHVKNAADAQDVTQEVFLRYLRRRPVFTDESHAKAWFIRVAVNCGHKLTASVWSHRTAPLEEIPEPRDGSSPLPVQAEVSAAVLSLPPRCLLPVYLHLYEGYTLREIAALTHTRESTVQTRMAKARSLLRTALSDDP